MRFTGKKAKNGHYLFPIDIFVGHVLTEKDCEIIAGAIDKLGVYEDINSCINNLSELSDYVCLQFENQKKERNESQI